MKSYNHNKTCLTSRECNFLQILIDVATEFKYRYQTNVKYYFSFNSLYSIAIYNGEQIHTDVMIVFRSVTVPTAIVRKILFARETRAKAGDQRVQPFRPHSIIRNIGVKCNFIKFHSTALILKWIFWNFDREFLKVPGFLDD